LEFQVADWTRFFSTSALLSAARAAGAAIAFGTHVLLARMLGAHDLGIYYSITSIAVVGALLVALGYPNITNRFISRYRHQNRDDRVAAFIRRAREDALFWGVIVALGITVAALAFPGVPDGLRYAIAVSAWTIIPASSQRTYSAVAMAYRRFAVSHLPTMLYRPSLFAALVVGFWLLGVQLSILLLVFVTLVSYIAATGIQYVQLRPVLRKKPGPVSRRMVRRWRAEAWPVLIVTAFTGILSDLAILIASPFMVSAEVAAFGVCLKIAFMIGFTVQSAHQVLLPEMGDAVARRESDALGRKILGASLFPIIATSIAVVLSALAGDKLLALFGDEFRASQNTLTILMFAQFVRALAGPSPFLMTMKGAQRTNALICAAMLVVLVAGNALLAPRFGEVGAAVALLGTTIVWLSVTGFALFRFDGARADIAGLLMRRRST
jgi:O-antigen/teichoic acid export membrane protein